MTAKRSKFRRDLTAFFHRGRSTENPLEAVDGAGYGHAEDRVRKAEPRSGPQPRAAHTDSPISNGKPRRVARRIGDPLPGVEAENRDHPSTCRREWRDYQEVFEDISTKWHNATSVIRSRASSPTEVTKVGRGRECQRAHGSGPQRYCPSGQARNEGGTGRCGKGCQGNLHRCPDGSDRVCARCRGNDSRRDGRFRSA